MKVPIDWLKDYIDISNEEELMTKLTAIGHMQDGPPQKSAGAHVYDLEVRQNRPDCLSLIGIAREAGAVLGKKVKHPKLILYNKVKGQTNIEILSQQLCYRFNTVTIEDLTVSNSPQWLKDKLTAYGIKTVNNLIDITNFVMVEMGQPLHAFDKAKVKNDTLIIRPAEKGENITLLGEKKMVLSEEDLVIADSEKPIALAGIMGGEDTSVNDKTTSIILEAATYNQATVRKSSLRHQIRTEASTRLEKFLDPTLTEVALQRAVELILQECGGKITDTTDSYPKKFPVIKIELFLDRLNNLGGIKFTQKQAAEYLRKLELNVESSSSSMTVTVPYFRTDLKLEEDLIEEVLRIHGYDAIQEQLPSNPPPKNIDSAEYMLEEQLRDFFVQAGLDEQITEPLTSEKNFTLEPVLLENSLNADKTMLRTTLKDSLLNSLRHQLKFGKKSIELFEIGKVYFRDGKDYKEKVMLGVVSFGVDYFLIKGLINLLEDHFETKLNTDDYVIEVIDENIYFFEILLERIKSIKIKRPLTNPPHVIFQDISLFVPKDTKVGDLIREITTISSVVSRVELGEEPKVIGDKKTVFLHLRFESLSKNLTNEIVSREKKNIFVALESKFKAKIRI